MIQKTWIRSFSSTARKLNNIKCSVILSRIPQIVKEESELTKEYWKYHDHKTIEQSLPFPVELYFKKGSLNERKWLERQSNEKDQLEGGSEEGSDNDIFNNVYQGNSRRTLADEKNDTQSLERALDKHLYLVVKKATESTWNFPELKVDEQDSLVTASRELIDSQLGDNLDIFQVGRAPIGHMKQNNDTVFFMKGRIMGGQVMLNKNLVKEFAWLTKDELERNLEKKYFEEVKDIL